MGYLLLELLAPSSGSLSAVASCQHPPPYTNAMPQFGRLLRAPWPPTCPYQLPRASTGVPRSGTILLDAAMEGSSSFFEHSTHGVVNMARMGKHSRVLWRCFNQLQCQCPEDERSVQHEAESPRARLCFHQRAKCRCKPGKPAPGTQ